MASISPASCAVIGAPSSSVVSLSTWRRQKTARVDSVSTHSYPTVCLWEGNQTSVFSSVTKAEVEHDSTSWGLTRHLDLPFAKRTPASMTRFMWTIHISPCYRKSRMKKFPAFPQGGNLLFLGRAGPGCIQSETCGPTTTQGFPSHDFWRNCEQTSKNKDDNHKNILKYQTTIEDFKGNQLEQVKDFKHPLLSSGNGEKAQDPDLSFCGRASRGLSFIFSKFAKVVSSCLLQLLIVLPNTLETWKQSPIPPGYYRWARKMLASTSPSGQCDYFAPPASHWASLTPHSLTFYWFIFAPSDGDPTFARCFLHFEMLHRPIINVSS